MGECVAQLPGCVASVAEVSFYMREGMCRVCPISLNLPTVPQADPSSVCGFWPWLAELVMGDRIVTCPHWASGQAGSLLSTSASGHCRAQLLVFTFLSSPPYPHSECQWLNLAPKIPVWAAAWDQVDVQRLCRTGLESHWLSHTGELAPSLTSYSTGEQALNLAWAAQ